MLVRFFGARTVGGVGASNSRLQGTNTKTTHPRLRLDSSTIIAKRAQPTSTDADSSTPGPMHGDGARGLRKVPLKRPPWHVVVLEACGQYTHSMQIKTRSPLRDKPLRLPGQSVAEERENLVEDAVGQPMMLALFFVLIAAFEWWRFYSNMKPSPILFSGVAVTLVLCDRHGERLRVRAVS